MPGTLYATIAAAMAFFSFSKLVIHTPLRPQISFAVLFFCSNDITSL
jgi:hypothetical protein